LPSCSSRAFGDLAFDALRYDGDRAYRSRYLAAEADFIEQVQLLTEGGVSIFIDNIGGPAFRATLRALGRLGVVATVGWKHGKYLSYDRATACIKHHSFVHTHGCRLDLCHDAMAYAEETGWLAPADAPVYGWDEVPHLAADFAAERLASYFPLFAVEPA
jgi:NADPH:quinone reductase-like Zn-dependent oxidoreductase